MVFKLIFMLFCLASFNSFAQNEQIAMSMVVNNEALDCRFSHDSSETYDNSKKLAVYLCAGKKSQSVLVKALGSEKLNRPDSWRHYSVINGHYAQGVPEKLTDANSKVFYDGSQFKVVESEFALLVGSSFENIYSLDSQNNPIPKEFEAVQKKIFDFAEARRSLLISSSHASNEVSFMEGERVIKCHRFKSKEAKNCFHYQCPNDQVIFFNPEDSLSGITLSKLSKNSGTSRSLDALEIPGFGTIKSQTNQSKNSEEAFYSLMTSPYSYYKMNTSNCEDPALTSFLKKSEIALEHVTAKLDQIQYKILARNVDGVLNLVSSVSIEPGDMCKFDDVYYDTKETSLEDLKSFLSAKSKNKVYRPADAQKVFDFFKTQKDIPWGYGRDGCYARAHLAAARAEDELGIDLDKTWVFGGGLSPKSDPSIKWSYHVAASINVKDGNGNIDIVVIDPALSDKPLKLEEWTALFSPSKEKPLRGSYKNVQYPVSVRSTYSVTGNEVYNIYELSSGYAQSDKAKTEDAERVLKEYSKVLKQEKQK